MADDRNPIRLAAKMTTNLNESLLTLPPAERNGYLVCWLAKRAGCALRLSAAEIAAIDPRRPLTALGLDSLAAIELAGCLSTELGVEVPLAELLDGASLNSIAASALAAVGAPTAVETASTGAISAAATTAERGDASPLSHGQRALWFLERLAPGGAVNQIVATARVRGGLDPDALARALTDLTRRHPALRTTFAEAGGEPVQRVHSRLPPEWFVEDARGWSAERLEARLVAAAYRPFDLERGPLVRLGHFLRPQGEQVLLFAIHHLIADFWSLAVLVRELGELYRSRAAGMAPAFAPIRLHPAGHRDYRDFVAAQERRLAGPAAERLWSYWLQRLGGELPGLDLPLDRPRPAIQTYRGAARTVLLPPALGMAIAALARARGATVYTVLLAAFQALLHRLTAQRDLVVGSPTAGRRGAEWSGVVGYFVNPIALRGDLGGDPTAAALIEQTRTAVLGALDHQELPLSLLVERLQPVRDPSRPPLLQVMFVLQRAQRPEEKPLGAFALGAAGATIDLGGVAVESRRFATRRTQLDLTLMVAELDERTGRLGASLQYNPDLFDAATMERTLGQFAVMLGGIAGIAAHPEPRLSQLPLLSAAESQQLEVEWNAAGAPAGGEGEAAWREPRPLHELFEAQAGLVPDRVALTAAAESLTYLELDRRAARLAAHLRQLGVGPEVRVGICARRSPVLVVGLLGILKAGGAYVPLDPAYPRERLAYLLADSAAAVLLGERQLAAGLPSHDARWVDLDRCEPTEPPVPAALRLQPENLAYVIYTSGSTGRPKGVGITHGSAWALLRWVRERFPPADLAAVLAATSICFDLSVFELFAPLACGGQVVLAEDALALADLPGGRQVTLINTVPSAMAELVRLRAVPASALTINLAGEPLPRSLVEDLLATGTVRRVLNLYGPSEDTTYSTCAVFSARSARPASSANSTTASSAAGAAPAPAIGQPVAGAAAYVLGASREPLPIGATGELYLSGAGLARGYLGRPDLTAERFVPDPAGGRGAPPGSRLYRTGDLVRRRADGELEFLGRLDQQVKVRGFRIEPGEIEAALLAHPAVAEAAVVVVRAAASGAAARGDPGDHRLAAFVVPAAAAAGAVLDPAALRDHLRSRLPEFMVPAEIVPLAVMPRTPNGKLDRRALAAMARAFPDPASTPADLARRVAMQTPTEELLAGIWSELLRVPRVAPDDDFFALGGHSLLAARVVARVHDLTGVELPVRSLFETPALAALAARVDAARGAAPPAEPIRREDRRLAPRLSFAQERLWFLDRLEPGSAVYNMPAAMRLSGRLLPGAFAAALAALARRHESLRTTFREEAGQPVQVIAPEADRCLPLIDLGAIPEPARRAEELALAATAARRPFDMACGPLLRTVLLRAGPARRGENPEDTEHVVVFTLHHIVSDGWSMGIFLRDLAALYGAALAGQPPPLPDLPVQYADYAAWQRRRLTGGVAERQLAYWRERLAAAPTHLDLPLDRPRPAVQSHRGATREVTLPAALSSALGALSRSHGATLFMTLLAAFQALLLRTTGEEDLLVGSPVANRPRPKVEELVGLFVNTLVLRADLSADPSFRDLLARVREGALAAYDHQELPFERLVEELRPERDLSRPPLVQVMFALQNAPPPVPTLPGLALSLLPVTSGTAKFDLMLALGEDGAGSGGHLCGGVEYATDLFDATTIQRFAGRYLRLLAAAVADPDRRLSALPLLSAAERQQLIAEWNDTLAVDSRARCLHQLCERQAALRPECVALVHGRETLTYGELVRRAARLARRLRGVGVGPETVVGVCFERSPELVVSMLGALTAGAAYLALDPALPRERLAFMIADAGVGVVLTRQDLGDRLSAAAVRLVFFDDAAAERQQPDGGGSLTAAVAAHPENLAYVIYTSGSTGQPKGVAIEHRGAANLVAWHRERFGLRPAEHTTQLAGLGFDASAWEIWSCLTAGATLHVVPTAVVADPPWLVRWLAAEGIDLCFLPTPLAEATALVAPWPRQLALRVLLTGGDRLHGHALTALPAAPFNCYGPTENSVVATCGRVAGGGADPAIGRPIANVQTYVLDRARRLLPLGVAGELHVGGGSLARGYVGKPELTAERFVPDPFGGSRGEAGGRLYRTGDLARCLPDGVIEFLGRCDRQIKLRGFRIEPGEIEAALAAHPAVAAAVAVLRQEGPADQRLVAYLTAAAPATVPTGAELRRFLAERLPEPMLPAAYVVLPALPLTANGKLDRQALARIAPARDAAAGRAPRTPAEQLLAGIWCELLTADRVAADDDFFALGGHSLLATRLLARLREAFGVELPVRTLFEHPGLADLAGEIERAMQPAAARHPAIPALPRPAGRTGGAACPFELPPSFSQERLWFLDQLLAGSPAYNVPILLELRGPLAPAALAGALTEVARRHEALRTTFAEAGLQVIAPPAPFPLPLVDLAGLAELRRHTEAERLGAAEARRPFDLARGPLIRGTLLRTAAQQHAALVSLHHIICDGASMGVLLAELAVLYQVLAPAGTAPPPAFPVFPIPALPALPIQYADFAVWQRSWLTGEVLEGQLRYWRRQLAGAPAALDLPVDRPRPAAQSFRGAQVARLFSPELSAELAAVARRQAVTPFMVLLAAFQTLLGRLSGQDDVLVGSPIANRPRPETEGLIGLFVNTLALRGELAGDPTAADLLARVRETCLGAYAHQDLPFDRLVEDLHLERDLSRPALVSVLLVEQNVSLDACRLGEVTLTPRDLATSTAKFDLTLLVGHLGPHLRATAELDTALFDAATVERLLGHFETLLAGLVSDPGSRLSRLPLLSAAERQQLEIEWNEGAFAAADWRPLHELFAAQAERTPERIAVQTAGESLTYRELARRSGRLAHHLCRLGVGPEVRVAICAERSPALVVGMLAILRAGGAYVPLDPAYPPERLAYLFADSAAAVLLTQERWAASLPSRPAHVVDLDRCGADDGAGRGRPLPLDAGSFVLDPRHLAYVIYTSGSTGLPKGVGITHGSVWTLLRWAREVFPPADLACVLASTSICFDLSVFELFSPLAWGGRILLAANALELPGVPGREQVTLVNTVPSAMAELVRLRAVPASVRTVNLAGEPLPRSLVDDLHALGTVGRVLNLYGPSEDTTYSTFASVAGGRPEAPAIGHPVAGTTAYVLGSRRELLPVGAAGELYLGGAGLARGYLGRPELTAERFVPDPFGDARGEAGCRLYRTGDLVRRRTGGDLAFLGRIDRQIKLRGFRIEPGEIEAALAAHPAIAAAAVIPRQEGPGEQRLVAYLTVEHTLPSAAELRRFLVERLPEPMLPAAYVVLPALPLTANGKLDRQALARIAPARTAGGRAPRTPAEQLLAGIWCELLATDRVTADDDFFALGGHSLLATRLLARLRMAFGVELPVRTLFEHPALADLAGEIERAMRPEAARPAAIPALPRLTGPAGGAVGSGGARGAGSAGGSGRTLEFPPSFAQERLWFLDQLLPGSPVYNVPILLELRGALAPAALAGALTAVARRHEALRTTFAEAGPGLPAGPVRSGPLQVIAPPAPFPVPLVDLAGLAKGRRDAEAERLAAAEARRAFDLARGPLIRATLLRTAEREHAALVNLHHVICDGASLGVLLAELVVLYQALAPAGPAMPPAFPGVPAAAAFPALPPLPIQYADFAVWQRSWLAGEVLDRQLRYWRRRLAGAPAALDLPVDRPRPAVQSFRGAQRARRLSPELSAALAAAARRHAVTPFMVLLAAFQVLLGRLSGQDDVLVGSPIANRPRPETEGLIGLFVNTLVLRGDLAGDPTAAELLARVRETSLGAYAHPDLPFERLVEELRLERDLSRPALVSVLLVDQNASLDASRLGELTLVPRDLSTGTAKFDLTLLAGRAEPHPGHLRLVAEYGIDLFDAATIERLLGHFETLLAGLVADPGSRLSRLPLLTAAERHQLEVEWNATHAEGFAGRGADWQERRPIHQLIAAQAERTPERIALVAPAVCLSYRELVRSAGRLASHLRRLGVGPDVRVGICAERSPAMVIGLLAILEAGGAYVPLDPAYPRERLAFLFDDSAAAVLLTQERWVAGLPSHHPRIVDLDRFAGGDRGDGSDRSEARAGTGRQDRPASVPVEPENLAYVIFTSGSTGRPKGVMNRHGGILNRLLWMQEAFPLDAGDRVLQKTPFSFDVSVWELFWPLLAGARLVLARPGGHQDPDYLAALIAAEGVTTVHFVPSMLQVFLDSSAAARCVSLRRVLCSGEALPHELQQRYYTLLQAPLYNLYGPTEAAVDVTCWACDPAAARPVVPIGRPIANTRVHVVDRGSRTVPLGVTGEILLGGAGLARGYLGRPDLTAERFLPDPLGDEPGGRLYRTGDLGRTLPDGSVEYLGRTDFQVKVRGFRIELGEIETVLASHPAVAQAVVTARGNGTVHALIAYLVVRQVGNSRVPPPSVSELREHLGARLPEYMVPAHFLVLPSLPLSAHGKVDRAALPAPSGARPDLEVPYVEPGTELERTIAAIWREVIGLERVGRQDNFFALGGTSLTITQVRGRLRHALGRDDLPLVDLFRFPTVAALAGHLAAAAPRPPAFEEVDERARRGREAVEKRRRAARAGSGR